MKERRIERRAAVTYCAVAREVTMETIGEGIGEAYDEIERYLASRGIEATGPSLIRYRRVSDDRPFVIEVGWIIDEAQWIEAPYIADVLPEGTYAVATHNGPFEDLSAITGDLWEWVNHQGAEVAAVPGADDEWACWYELYLTDPVWGVRGPEGVVEVCFSLAESEPAYT